MDPIAKESSHDAHEKKEPQVEEVLPATQAETQKPAGTSGVTYGDEEEEESKTVKLSGTKVKSAEEDETLIYIKRAKLYRFRDGKWKERGEGYCKILRSNENKI